MNPAEENYQAPRAGYQGKGHIVYEEIEVFSIRQRLNRLRFACYSLASSLIFGLLALLSVLLMMAAGQEKLFWVPIIPLVLLAMAYYITLMVRRLHDLGKSGWMWLLIFVPMLAVPFQILMPGATTLVYALTLFGPLFTLYLMAGAGTSGMNSYGTPNPPNGILVMFFGGIFWLLNVLGLLANFAVLALSFFAPEVLENAGQIDPGQINDMEALQEALRKLSERK